MDHTDAQAEDINIWNAAMNTSSTTSAALPSMTDVITGDTVVKWVTMVFPPVILLFGLVGNILTVLVLSRGNWNQGTMPIYLITLSVIDTAQLIVGLLRLWLIAVFQLDIRNISNLGCKTLVFMTHVLMYFSSWIVVSITIERTIAIVFPLGWKCTRTKAKLTLLFLGILFCGISGHTLYGFTLTETGRCMPIYTPGYHVFMSWVNMAVASIAPSSILVATNAAIIWQIRRSNRNLSEFESHTRGKNGGKGRSSSKTTKMLILLSAAYLVTTLPINIVMLAHSSEPSDPVKFWVDLIITEVLMYCNNAVNFYLYCLSGSSFKRQLSGLFSCHCIKKMVYIMDYVKKASVHKQLARTQ